MTREEINKKFMVINKIKTLPGDKTIEYIIKTLPDIFKIPGISYKRIYSVLKKKEIV